MFNEIKKEVGNTYDFFDFYTTLLFNGNNVTKKQLEWTLCGFPSKDGRGATLRNNESCGITSCCGAKDGAWEFIKTAISEEVQDELVYFPININSFERMGNYWIEYGNNYMYGVFNKENYFSYDVVDTFETWIRSIDVAYYKYPIANIIINEEMPAYFKGNKDINTVIDGDFDKSIPDYLITTWLMAIYMNGLNREEAYLLTKSMWEHSAYIDLTSYGKPIIDKHSTGGIGDKVSLILLPIIASLGIAVAKISGRGLGFTGGTIDKLESVGVRCSLTKKEMINQLHKNKIFIIAQTSDIAPVDKVWYHLRDVTGTVPSIPLIRRIFPLPAWQKQ